jgi:hypothetical protein
MRILSLKYRQFILRPNFIFIILFALLAVLYYDSVLEKPPLSHHTWRQSDCLSLTKNYAEGASFWEPEMHIQLGDNKTSGKSAGEFPILYYGIGQIWKIFGESFLSYRLIYLIILFFGVFAFYKTLLLLLKNKFWSISLSLLLCTSPVFMYYGVSFLTDAPSFSFTLIALYFFTSYSIEGRQKLLYLSMGFFALAGLIKVSSLIAFLFLFGILILETLPFKLLNGSKLFKYRKNEWIAFGLTFLVVFAWYYYANYYNSIHRFKYTFNSTYPLWKVGTDEFEKLLFDVNKFTSRIFFSRPLIWFLTSIAFLNLLLLKKIPWMAYLSNIGIIMACLCYVLLWAPLMGIHDYYFAALLILFPGILVPFFLFLKQHYQKIYSSPFTYIIFSGFLIFNIIYCLSVIQLKTKPKDKPYAIIGNKQLVHEMKWFHSNAVVNEHRFLRIRSYLVDLKITKDKKVIVFPDASFNTSLYLMDRKGWTNFNNYSSKEEIEELISKGAEYLFIADPSFLETPFMQSFLKEHIGSFEGIEIFKL